MAAYRGALMRVAVTVSLVLTLVGCATAARVGGRAATDAEAQLVARAIIPLLYELGYALPRGPDDCRIALIVVQANAINAATAPGSATPCTLLALGITEGALRRLPVEMLRAIFAHELGHVHLGHLETRRKRRSDMVGALLPFTRSFDRQEEAAADAFAVDLLRRLEPQHRGACVALVYVFALLAEQAEGPGRWFSTHPSPDRRAETAITGCNR
jgi:Zn-dependent protease with chaperone function